MTSPGTPAGDPPAVFVLATIPRDNIVPGAALVTAHADVIDEVTPALHRIGRRGGITSLFGPQDLHPVGAAVAAMRATGRPLLPSISDEDGDWDEVVREMLGDPASAVRHVWALADLARRRGYAGVEVRYAALHETGGDVVAFVARLAEALHAGDRRLAIALDSDGRDGGPTVCAEVGAVVDEVRLATWDAHWVTSPPGPLAPLEWLHQQLVALTRTVDPGKVVAGVPAAGCHWIGPVGAPIGHDEAIALAARVVDGRIGRDPASRSRWFAYTDDDGTPHEVWFEDAASIAAKRAVLAEAGVHAMALWLSADPDPAVWGDLAR